MVDAMKELQEQQLRTNKAIVDLAGTDSGEKSNKNLRSLITIIRSKHIKKKQAIK